MQHIAPRKNSRINVYSYFRRTQIPSALLRKRLSQRGISNVVRIYLFCFHSYFLIFLNFRCFLTLQPLPLDILLKFNNFRFFPGPQRNGNESRDRDFLPVTYFIIDSRVKCLSRRLWSVLEELEITDTACDVL